MTRVLVTGGTGFVGRHICRSLTAAGFQVAVATRNPRSAEALVRADVRTIPGFGPRFDWSGVLRDVEYVVHAAARTDSPGGLEPPGSEREFQRCNVEGTAKLARDAASAGVRRLVLISTAVVHGDATPNDQPLTEDSPLSPVGIYARSKADAERALAAEAAASALTTVVLRPPPVYGPGMRPGNLFALMRLATRLPVLPFGGFIALRSLVSVGNLAEAVQAAIVHPAAAGRTYLVRDAADVSVADLLRAAAASVGRRPLIIPVPPALLRVAASMVGKGAAIDRLAAAFRVDDARIRRELDWTPSQTMVQGVNETVASIAAETSRR